MTRFACFLLVIFIIFNAFPVCGQAAQSNSTPAKTLNLEVFLRQIATSKCGPEWELQHYDPAIRFSPTQLIKHFRKVEQKLLRKGVENDQPTGPIHIEEGARYPLQGELSDTLALMSRNPSTEYLPELKRIIKSAQLPGWVRGRAVAVFAELGGDTEFLYKALEIKDDFVRGEAIGAIGLRLAFGVEIKPLQNFIRIARTKLREIYLSNSEEGISQMQESIVQIEKVLDLRNLAHIQSSSEEYSKNLKFIFDTISMCGGIDTEAVYICDTPSTKFAIYLFNQLVSQDEKRALQIIYEHISANKTAVDSYTYKMLLLDLPLNGEEIGYVNNTLRRYGVVDIRKYPKLNIPGVKLYQSKKSVSTTTPEK